MKNKFLTAGFILISGFAGAQIVQPAQTPQTPAASTVAIVNESSGFKPASGDVTFEMNFNPFSAQPLSLNYLKARYFLSESTAARMGMSLGLQASSGTKIMEYALLPGFEKHFRGAERLSPYMGAELLLAGRSASFKEVSGTGNNTVTTKIKGSDGNQRGFFNFGINAVIGADFYFSKRIYMGLEAGYGFVLSSASTITTTVIPNGGTTTITTVEGGSSFQIGPNFNSALRIGFAF